MARAIDHGVAGTPAGLFGDDLVLLGAQPRELFTRIVNRLRARTGDAPSGPVR
jgi:predicted DsbA family dithiol-disulfide isomerase